MSPFIKNHSLHQMMHITRFPLVFVQIRVPAVSHQTANADKQVRLSDSLF
ncbi:hypothetical protein B4140_2313 [Bacillus amyloliquefaciens]|nr:hypothetical protein B4140_2313 [Bacillus amyloliquefaciens]